MSDDAAAPVSLLSPAVQAAPAVASARDLVCRPCGVLLMRASTVIARASIHHDTVVLCPSCGTKLRWRH
jgi:RNase P subunit RPR2